MADTPTLPPLDLNIASERLELLAQIYKETLPERSIAPLSNSPDWLSGVDAAATATDLAHVFSVYVDCKKQELPEIQLQGLVLQGQSVVSADNYPKASVINSVFGTAESILSRAPVLCLTQLGFTEVRMSAQEKNYTLTAQYKGKAVEFQISISDADVSFVRAAKEIKSYLDTNPANLTAADRIVFTDADNKYKIVRGNGASTVEIGKSKVGQLSAVRIVQPQPKSEPKAEEPKSKPESEPVVRREESASPRTSAVVTPPVVTAPVVAPPTNPTFDYQAHLQQSGFANVTLVQKQNESELKGSYAGIDVEFSVAQGSKQDVFTKAVAELKKFIDAKPGQLAGVKKIVFSEQSLTYKITLRRNVALFAAGEAYTQSADSVYTLPQGKLSVKNYARLDAAYEQLSKQLLLPNVVSADWGDFDYELKSDNTIYAVTNDPAIIDVNERVSSFLVDERLPIMSPDQIRSLKENGRDIGGPAKLQYYARLFDADAPGVFNITESDYMDMVESLGHYPKSYYKGSVTIDDVIDVVLLKALNADYEADLGPMKNMAGIHGLGQFSSSPRALLMLIQIAAHSDHDDLKHAARAEYQNFYIDRVEDLHQLTTLFNSKKPDSFLALELMDALAWVYYNSTDQAVKQEIANLSVLLNEMNEEHPPERPSLLAADFDQGHWNYYVRTFALRIAKNDPEASNE